MFYFLIFSNICTIVILLILIILLIINRNKIFTKEKVRLNKPQKLNFIENKFEEIFKLANNISIIVTNADPVRPLILEFSPGAEKIFGYEKEEVINKPVEVLHIKEDVEKIPETINSMEKNKKGFHGISILVRKNGEKFPALFTTYPIFDNSGKMNSALGISIDLSDYEKIYLALDESKKKLKESEERFRLLAQNARDAIYRLNINTGKYEYISPSIEKITGFTVEEFYKDPKISLKIIHPEYKEDINNFIKRISEGDIPSNFECKIITKSGEVKWTNQTNVSVKDKNGKIIAMESVVRDITELKTSEENFKNIVNNSPMGIHLYEYKDNKLIFTGFNNSANKILGVDNANFVGKSIEDAFPPLAETEFPFRYKKAALEGESWHTEQINYEYEEISGVYLVYVFQTSYGKVAVLFSDITEQKKNQIEREKLFKELSLKNQELESVIHAASHDLRTPLINIQGFGHELLLAIKDLSSMINSDIDFNTLKNDILNTINEDFLTTVTIINKNVDKIDKLLNGLLKISRIGRVVLNKKELKINLILKSVIDTFDHILKEKNISIKMDKLPMCYGDEEQILHVFSNLINNAVKYIPDDRDGIIRITGKKNVNSSVYIIEDNGIGIRKEHQDNIFEIFHRLNPDDNIGGDGLGLSIVKRILDMHNGKVWIESNINKGSKFYIELPNE